MTGFGAVPGVARSDTLAERVAVWAGTRADDAAFTELAYRGTKCVPTTLTYGQLHRAAGEVAHRLRVATAPGDRVAILTAHGLDYVVAFLGCLYANRTAVPLFPVSGSRNTDRLDGVLADAEPSVSLLSAADTVTEPAIGRALGEILRLPDDLTQSTTTPVIDPIGSFPAYLQYTSGSTKAPAGVEVGHDHLAAALGQLWGAIPAIRDRPIVTWLPFFHDMGLVLALSMPLYSCVPGVTMAPMDFVKRPIRWLRACSDYRAGVTGSPNFGLALAISATTPEERAGLDLSGLDVLFNGAEPVRAEVLTEFTETFAPSGFRHHAHTPGYGLAEATLTVTVSVQDAEPVTKRFDRGALTEGRAVASDDDSVPALPLVGCGAPAGQHVAVVDPADRTEVAAGTVGEIWVSGPNVCGGYHANPAATVETFAATLTGRTERWLRTGDLGFWHDGQLYVAGRLKDLIVIDGRNHYPADIESTVASAAPEIRPGHITAFGTDGGQREDLVVIAELATDTAESAVLTDIARRIRGAVATAHEVMPGSVVLVEPGRIPKTSSGKLRRTECRRLYNSGTLPRLLAVGKVPPAG
ncbi:fatty acyl-AMP ligase [Nocardia puris]|uniref:Fatty acid CoA ligase FadD32 n=1 Tax=Nocardia puris TaxID=208602 RepID=A0A366DNA7_9NOCA|nr:fatty acyl-AMP ligase [Nocardia puris]RBO91570.1 fatty acid CoA ligase FadD32 [Nocardia puris]